MMPLEIDNRIYIFRRKDVWFSDNPYEIKGYDTASFYSCKNRVEKQGFQLNEFSTLIIDLAKGLDEIWDNFGKKSCRYEINRATRSEIKIHFNQDYYQFYEMNQQFRKEKGLPLGFEKLEVMQKHGTLFTAWLDNEMLGGQLYLEDKNNIRWLIGASRRLEVEKEKAILIGCGNRLMIWEAIKYAKEKGITNFDFGGYYTGSEKDDQKERINVFKKSFGGSLALYYNYTRDYSLLYKIAKYLYQIKNGITV